MRQYVPRRATLLRRFIPLSGLALTLGLGILLMSTPAPPSATKGVSTSTLLNASTPEPGLVITGYVRLNDATGPGLAGVTIYRTEAGYPGTPVAVTDSDGYYNSGFASIPGDEMVTVWAAKDGYTIDPQQYYWRHYHGYQARTLDFVARPLVTTCVPSPAPKRLLVDRGSWTTIEFAYPLYIYLGRNGSTAANAVITVTSEAGTVTTTGQLSIFTSMPITIPLLLNTVHHPVVYGQFQHTAECFYVTSTAYDLGGYPLTITQQSFTAYLPFILRDN